MAHRYLLGEAVRFSSLMRIAAAAGEYKVVAHLPQVDGQRGYRIKSALENHERTAGEEQLHQVEETVK